MDGREQKDVRASKSPSEMAYRGKLHASERRSLKRSLETAKPRAKSLGGSVVAKVSDYTQASVSDSSEAPSHCCP